MASFIPQRRHTPREARSHGNMRAMRGRNGNRALFGIVNNVHSYRYVDLTKIIIFILQEYAEKDFYTATADKENIEDIIASL